jgi:glucan phosphorylase
LRPVEDPRIVAIGGGTGLPIVLEGLKRELYTEMRSVSPERDRDRLTAIVTARDADQARVVRVVGQGFGKRRKLVDQSAQRRIDKLWMSSFDWTRTSMLNIAGMAWFSSDRAIREYAREIWDVGGTRELRAADAFGR